MDGLIPLDRLKTALENYAKLYNYVRKAQFTFRHVCERARSSLIYLLYMPILLIVGIIMIQKNTDFFLFGGVILIAIFALRIITFESVMGRKRGFHIGPIFHINNFIRYTMQLHYFKNVANLKSSVLYMILFPYKCERKEAARIERYFYTYGIGEELNEAIREYNTTYKGYRDFVNFDQHWTIVRELYGYVKSGRASTGGEALRYYDLQEHRRNVENEIQRQNDINQAMVDAERERIEEYKNAKKAAKEYKTAVQDLTHAINENGGITHEDVETLKDTLNK